VLKKQDNVSVILHEVGDIDLARNVLIFPRGEIKYDYLVLATGVETTYYGRDEFKPHAPGLKSIDDALEIRRRILIAYEAAELEADVERRRAILTFVIVGGGPTGVEMAGAISDAAQRTLPKDFRYVDTTTTRIILVDGGDRLLSAMPEAASKRAQADLAQMGVEIRLNSRVNDVTELGVVVGDEMISAENVFWAAGVQGVPLVHKLGAELDRAGRVIVGSDLSIPGHPNAFVIGDAAHAIDAETGNTVPGMAQGAIQGGKFVAKIIKTELSEGAKTTRPAFSYVDKGSMAMIGRGKAVAAIGKRTFGGFLGWLAWSGLHVAFLVGFRRKFTVLLMWFWNYIGGERAARIITGDPEIRPKMPQAGQLFSHLDDEMGKTD
jgi:NADH dehydrogenase